MATKLVMDNEPSLEPLSSLFKTAVWTVALLLVAELSLGLILGIYYEILQESNISFTSISMMLTLTLLSPLINIPLLVKATPALNWPERLLFWSIRELKKQELIKWIFVGFIFWAVASIVDEIFNLPVEQFMLDVKAEGDSFGMLVFLFITICLVSPIMEEIIFRGWLFSKIAQTKLGKVGSLLFTSFIFTAMHSQYGHNVTLLMILALGLLLGFIRYKSNNIIYCIIVHMLLNTSALVALFLL